MLLLQFAVVCDKQLHNRHLDPDLDPDFDPDPDEDAIILHGMISFFQYLFNKMYFNFLLGPFSGTYWKKN
jgi:hypothetical protein